MSKQFAIEPTSEPFDDPRAAASRLEQGYIEVMLAAQFARERGLISAKFASTFSELVSECCTRLKSHIEPAAAAKRRQLAEAKNKF